MVNRRNWQELPSEITTSILGRLGAVDILVSARKVCRSWRGICSDPAMWRIVDLMITTEPDHDFRYRLEILARKAVDLSGGEMIDITLHHFLRYNTLFYIADRSSQLRRLCLVSCIGNLNNKLPEMVKKLPLLEELHLYGTYISNKAIEAVGRFCPQLKSFTLNNKIHSAGPEVDAVAIAKTMHGLRHLNLYGNTIAINGLLAILNHCPHLESLDIRQCLNLAYMEPFLVRRLFQQIKVLRLPYDSTEANDFDDGYQNFLRNT